MIQPSTPEIVSADPIPGRFERFDRKVGSTVSTSTPSLGFRHIWFPAFLFISLVLLFEMTDLDLRLSDLFFDFDRGRFFWKDAWWATQLMHKDGRLAVMGLALACGLLFIRSLFKRSPQSLFNAQRAFLYLLLSLALGPGTVAGLKLVINRPYPEHIQRFGGALPYTKLFQKPPETARKYPGFPAAHASAGYALVALYFIYREKRDGLAYAGLALGLTVGTVFGFGQQVRGMHYASHNVWSAAICWYTCILLYLGPFRRRLSGPLSMARRGARMRSG